MDWCAPTDGSRPRQHATMERSVMSLLSRGRLALKQMPQGLRPRLQLAPRRMNTSTAGTPPPVCCSPHWCSRVFVCLVFCFVGFFRACRPDFVWRCHDYGTEVTCVVCVVCVVPACPHHGHHPRPATIHTHTHTHTHTHAHMHARTCRSTHNAPHTPNASTCLEWDAREFTGLYIYMVLLRAWWLVTGAGQNWMVVVRRILGWLRGK